MACRAHCQGPPYLEAGVSRSPVVSAPMILAQLKASCPSHQPSALALNLRPGLSRSSLGEDGCRSEGTGGYLMVMVDGGGGHTLRQIGNLGSDACVTLGAG